jgi:energy-converting hydrogenase Eha subunit C
MAERKWGWHILGGMKRHTPWIQLVAVALVLIGLITLAAPAPAQAMDPQLMLALASAAGAIALIVGYLIVANGREKQRAASLEGIYACGDQEASGPMGCGSPGPARSAPAAFAAAPDSPMAADGRIAPRTDTLVLTQACPVGQASGPMGCGGPMGLEPVYSSASSAPAALPSAVQGQ